MRCFFSLKIILLLASTWAVAHENNVDHSHADLILRDAQVQYAKGQYTSVISGLNKILPIEQHFDGIQQKTALALYGISLFLADLPTQAEKIFKKLLYLDRTYQLDPFDTPPPVLAFFEQQKAAVLKNLSRIEKLKQKKHTPSPSQAKSIQNLTTFEKLIPLGYPQFQRGQTSKGIALISAGGAALTLNLVGYWWKRSVSTGNVVRTQSDMKTYRTAQGLQIAGISLLAATIIYGVVDAFLNP